MWHWPALPPRAARGLWDQVMVNDLKYYDGSVQSIDRIPGDIKQLYSTAFEIDPLRIAASEASTAPSQLARSVAVFRAPVDAVVRIRTGEEGGDAI